MVEIDAASILPQVTWGTSPEMVTGIDGRFRIWPASAIRCDVKGWSARSSTWD